MEIFKLGIKLLFACLAQIILIIICYDFFAVYRLRQVGSAILSAMDNVNRNIWYIVVIEFVISIGCILYGLIKCK